MYQLPPSILSKWRSVPTAPLTPVMSMAIRSLNSNPIRRIYTVTPHKPTTHTVRHASAHASACLQYMHSPSSASVFASPSRGRSPGRFLLPSTLTFAATSINSTNTNATTVTAAATDAGAPFVSSMSDATLAATMKDSIQQTIEANSIPVQLQDDSFFATPTLDSAHPVVKFITSSLHFIHDTTGMPWWATLFTAGILARVAMIPLQIYQARITAGIAGLEPIFMVLDMKAKDMPQNMKTSMHIARVKWNLYKRYGCSPWKLVPPALLQIGVFVGMAVSLRGMIRTAPDFSTGGFAWFDNLAVMDPYYVLPIVAISASYGSSLAMEWFRNREAQRMREKATQVLTNPSTADAIKSAPKTQSSPSPMPLSSTSVESPSSPPSPSPAPATPPPTSHLHELQHYLRGLSLLTIPWVVHLPSGIFFFWFAGTIWTNLSAWVLRHPTIRDKLGLTWKEDLFQRRVDESIKARQSSTIPTPEPVIVQRAPEKRKPTVAERYATKRK